MTEIMEARRKGFDEWYVKNRGTLGCGTYKDDLYLWNAALDSVCVELPPTMECDDHWTGDITVYDAAELRSAIERAGLKVKP